MRMKFMKLAGVSTLFAWVAWFALPASAQENKEMTFAEAQKFAIQVAALGGLDEMIAGVEEFIANPPEQFSDRIRAEQLMRLVELYRVDAAYLGNLPNAELRERIKGYYEEAARIIAPESLSSVNLLYAQYLTSTFQIGPALNYYRAVIRDEYVADMPTNELEALRQIAQAYFDLGEFDYALAAIDRYRALEQRIPEPMRIDAHLGVTPEQLNLLWAQGNLESIASLWLEDKPMLKSNRVAAEIKVSAAAGYIFYLNKLNDTKGAAEAEKMFRAGVEKLPGVQAAPWSQRREIAKHLSDCSMMLSLGNIESLITDARYIEHVDDCDGMENGSASATRYILTKALVLERQGHDAAAIRTYEKIIQSAERVRGSFGVSDRSTFFAGNWREPYDGIIRIRVRRFLTVPASKEIFGKALLAVDRARARQFGELSGQDNEIGTVESLNSFIDALPEGTAVIVLASQQDEQIALGFTRDLRKASVFQTPLREFNERIRDLHGILEDADSDTSEIEELMASLSSDVLGPVGEVLAGARDVIVIADGPLARIPFSLFSTSEGDTPIGLSANVSYKLSLRSLQENEDPSASEGFFGAGNPIYPSSAPETPLDDGINFELQRSIEFSEAVKFSQLPFARRELTEVAAKFDAEAQLALTDSDTRDYSGESVRVLMDSDATEDTIKRALSSGIGIVHLASHGLLAGDLGLFEPALVLGAGNGQDGYLTASEVEDLEMDTRLTVLSACSSGDGALVAGEGVIGLARAFLVAGSDQVLVSMWPINDAATAEWMGYFYDRLRSGARAEEALREASVEMQTSYSEPKYWAPFILVSN